MYATGRRPARVRASERAGAAGLASQEETNRLVTRLDAGEAACPPNGSPRGLVQNLVMLAVYLHGAGHAVHPVRGSIEQ